MNVVLVEDEMLAAEKLTRYLKKYDRAITVVATLVSIAEAVDWFNNNNNFDLVFMDIQLTDGLSFEIFNQTNLHKPIIFTTAFDEYAIDAFKVHSIDYILKPITFTDLSNAMQMLQKTQVIFSKNTVKTIQNSIEQSQKKSRFLVRLGNHIHSIKTTEIQLFYADGRTVYLVTNQGKKFIVDYRLEDLLSMLQSNDYFRVNRTFIININAIKDVVVYSNSRLKITPTILLEKEIIVSREKVADFKNWFQGNNY